MKIGVKKAGVILALIVSIIFVANTLILPVIASKFVRMEASYIEYPVETMIKEADIIFVGQVVEISQTSWNQETGRYWNGGLPYHMITLSRIQPIVGEIKDEVHITIIGNNPLDEDTVLERNHALKTGDELIVFARNTEFAWRTPERIPAVMFMGGPQTSILIKAKDGLYHSINNDVYSLDDFIDEVRQKRAEAVSMILPPSMEMKAIWQTRLFMQG